MFEPPLLPPQHRRAIMTDRPLVRIIQAIDRIYLGGNQR